MLVIGGGVGGCSAAYHLAKCGAPDILVLERASLGAGTTWHSTGNMETYRDDPLILHMVRYAVSTFPLLESESGQQVGWKNVGRVMYTDRESRFDTMRTLPEFGSASGIEVAVLTPEGVAQRLKIIDPTGLVGGLWIPSDGRVNPTDLVMAYSRAARRRGVKISEQARVLEILVHGGAVCGVLTKEGIIECNTILLAAGLWSREIAKSCGIELPLYALEHQYIITDPIPGLDRSMPLFLSYDDQLYGREEVGGLIVGSFDDAAIPIAAGAIPQNFAFSLLNERWEQFEPYMATAMRRFPALRTAGIKMLLNGPEGFTPDGQMLLGPVPGVDGLFAVCGFNSNGIALSAAAGRYAAEWIVEGAASADVAPLDVRRFSVAQSSERYLRERVSEMPGYLSRTHEVPDDYQTGRLIRRSPIHEQLIEMQARFHTVGAWERPLWFALPGPGVKWLEAVATEYSAASTGMLLIDRSADAKLALLGAADTLSLLLKLPAEAHGGAARFHALPGDLGQIEALPRLLPWETGTWLLTAGPEQETRLGEWARRTRRAALVHSSEMTSAHALWELAGSARGDLLSEALSPRARAAEDAYTHTHAWLGTVPIRIFEDPVHESTLLLAPADGAVAAWEHLWSIGASHGLRMGGHLAQEALRIARGVPGFGREATPDMQVRELFAELGRAHAHPAGELSADRGRRVVVALSSPAELPGFGSNEPVLAADRVVGRVTSRVRLPGWTETLLLAVMDAAVAGAGGALEIIARGRRLPVSPRRAAWSASQNQRTR